MESTKINPTSYITPKEYQKPHLPLYDEDGELTFDYDPFNAWNPYFIVNPNEMMCHLCEYNAKCKSNLQRHLKSRKHQTNVKRSAELTLYVRQPKYLEYGFYCPAHEDFCTQSIYEIQKHIRQPFHEEEIQEYQEQEFQKFYDEVSCLNGFGPIEFAIERDKYGNLSAFVN